MGKKIKGCCYYCGKTPTSREHLPPQQFFKGFTVDSLTVPSCKDHNNEKSHIDEAITKSMLLPLEKKAIVKNDDIKLALENVKPHYNQVKKELSEQILYKHNNTNFDCIVLNPDIDLSDWIKKLSAGLIYYKTRFYDCMNNFDKSYVFERNSYVVHKTPHSLLDFENEYIKKVEFEKILEKGDWFDDWNDQKNKYPETIYKFNYKFIGKLFVIRHWFFQQFKYYNIIKISDNTKEKIFK